MAVKYLKIDTFSDTDTDALFVALCKNTCNIDANEAKILVSYEKLDKKTVIGYKATLTDLVSLIGMYDIPFEFKVSYLDQGVVAKGVLPAEKKNVVIQDDSRVCDTYKEMEKQKRDLENLEVSETKTEPPSFTPEPKKEIDPSLIPKFM